MSIKSKPSPSSQPPLLKNSASAPVIYFDTVPAVGTAQGNIEIELATRFLLPNREGGVSFEMSCTAHLRCSIQAASVLAELLTRSIEMAQKQQEHELQQANEMLNSAPNLN